VNKSKVSNGNTNVNSKIFFKKIRKQEQSATVLKVTYFCSERYHCLKPLLLVSALGQTLPPYMIYKGQRLTEELICNGMEGSIKLYRSNTCLSSVKYEVTIAGVMKLLTFSLFLGFTILT
jgi:hypothetical protein